MDLSQAFDLLQKKGLGKASMKGPFYHDLNKTLYHVAEAHIHEDWLVVGKFISLAEEELVSLANQIVEDHGSSSALNHMDAKPENQRDEVKQQTIMWNCDILQYIMLHQAVKHGDVGLMEDSLPHLLLQFVGGKKSNYATEVLELLQSLQCEWSLLVK